MFAQINHIAIISSRYPVLAKFYEAVFGLKPPAKNRPLSAVTIGDGYAGLNLIPRRDGYVEGIDHFGMVVDEIAPVRERMLRQFPKSNLVRRPSARPFAAFSGHDPDGNIFDLAQREADTRKEIYAEISTQGWAQDRYMNRFAIRTPNAEQVAEFYAKVFDLSLAGSGDAEGWHLSDGRVTLSILPWAPGKFAGMPVKRPGPDHIGFRVENLSAFRTRVAEVAAANPFLASVPMGGSQESDVRKALFCSSASGAWQMSDPDGNWIDISCGEAAPERRKP